MRFGKFESGGLKPLGQGENKKVFVNPQEPTKVIAEIKTGPEIKKDSPELLKGTYYLTKIAHLLLPKHVPEVYQAGETEEGQQTMDRQRIEHTPGHALLQSERQAGGDEQKARLESVKEMGKEMGEVDMELERIGFGFNIDDNAGNYSKDGSGNVYYLDTFKPWETYNTEEGPELQFDEELLAKAINETPDQGIREKCEQYLSRIHALFEEEKAKLPKVEKPALPSCEPGVKALEDAFAAFEAKHDMAFLFAIDNVQIALNSPERKAAQEDFKGPVGIVSQLQALQGTDIAAERYADLNQQYKKLWSAVGTLRNGKVDHSP